MLKPLRCLVLAMLVAAGAGAVAGVPADADTPAARELALANHDLAAAVQGYRQHLPWLQRLLFDRSQASWQSYRRAACAFEGSGLSDGGARSRVIAVCRETLTQQRLRYIEALSRQPPALRDQTP